MKVSILLYLTLLCNLTFLYAQQDYATRKKHFNIDATGLAVQGYDVFSYFEGKPTNGLPTNFIFHIGINKSFPQMGTWKLLKPIQANLNLLMVVGVPMQWAAMEKKSK